MPDNKNLVFDLDVAAQTIAKTIGILVQQAQAAIRLLDDGNTIPFIARYRKEATNGLDEIALRAIEDALEKARELFSRRNTILKSIDEQGLLTDSLRAQIHACQDMQSLEAETPNSSYHCPRAWFATVSRHPDPASSAWQSETRGFATLRWPKS
jgi:hypothetical protein